MNETALLAIIFLVSLIATSLGYVIATLKTRHQIETLKQKHADLNDRLDDQKTTTSEKFLNVEKMREELEQSLFSLIPEQDSSNLNNRDQFVQRLLRPLQESLRSTDQQTKRIIRSGQKAQQQIEKQLDILHAPQQFGRGSIKALTDLLEDTETRNRWGIKTLKNLLELTSMTDHYRMRKTAAGENACSPDDETMISSSPPCLIRLPDNSQIAIDPNIPLDAYVNICKAPEATIRNWHMESHARKLREHIMEMCSHAYMSQYEQAPAVQVLMILNDHYLATALEIDNDLLQLAQKHNLILATPADLFNLFQTIAHGWQQQDFVSDAKKIRETGIHLYKRFGTFIKLIAELGSELGSVLNSYNRAVSVFSSARVDAEKRISQEMDIGHPLPKDRNEIKKSA